MVRRDAVVSEAEARQLNVTLYDPPSSGGVHFYALGLAEGLIASGCAVGFTNARRRQVDIATLEFARKGLDKRAAPGSLPVVKPGLQRVPVGAR